MAIRITAVELQAKLLKAIEKCTFKPVVKKFGVIFKVKKVGKVHIEVRGGSDLSYWVDGCVNITWSRATEYGGLKKEERNHTTYINASDFDSSFDKVCQDINNFLSQPVVEKTTNRDYSHKMFVQNLIAQQLKERMKGTKIRCYAANERDPARLCGVSHLAVVNIHPNHLFLAWHAPNGNLQTDKCEFVSMSDPKFDPDLIARCIINFNDHLSSIAYQMENARREWVTAPITKMNQKEI